MHKAIFLGYDKLNFLCAYFTNALWWSCWAHLLIRKGRFSSQATQLYHDLMHHHHHHHCSHHCNHSHIIKDNLSSSCIDCSSIGSYFDKLNEAGLCIATHCFFHNIFTEQPQAKIMLKTIRCKNPPHGSKNCHVLEMMATVLWCCNTLATFWGFWLLALLPVWQCTALKELQPSKLGLGPQPLICQAWPQRPD